MNKSTTRRWIGAFTISFLAWAGQVQAQGLPCGVYENQLDHDEAYVIDSANTAQHLRSGVGPVAMQVVPKDKTWVFYGLPAGYQTDDAFSFQDSPPSIRPLKKPMFADKIPTYKLTKSAACKPAVATPPGGCRADMAACNKRLYEADEAALGRWCRDEQVAFACDQLIDQHQKRADGKIPAQPKAEVPTPPVCQEGQPTYAAEECKALSLRMLKEAMPAMVRDLAADMAGKEDKALPAAQLDQIAAYCKPGALVSVCEKIAEKMWDAQRFTQARDALKVACEGRDRLACDKLEPLRDAKDSDFQVSAAVAMPCGKFASTTGLIKELAFANAGMVSHDFGGKLRARLANGVIRVRHDKGGDFVFRPVGPDRLIGVDSWNRFAVYERQGKTPRCTPPIGFTEKDLPNDCPATDVAEWKSCCAAGKMQGCNALGHSLALSGKWAEAKPHYVRVCREGIRAGCMNLVKVASEDEAAGKDVPALLKSMCKASASHVACDVSETTNWNAVFMGSALKQLNKR